MSQVKVRLSTNESRLMWKVPVELNDYRDLSLVPGLEDRWFIGGENIPMSRTTFITNAILTADKVKVNPTEFRRLYTDEQAKNSANTDYERVAININEGVHNKLKSLMMMYRFKNLGDTLVWCIENYSHYLWENGLPLERRLKPRRKDEDKYGVVVTIRVSKGLFETFDTNAKQQFTATGRLIKDFLTVAVNNHYDDIMRELSDDSESDKEYDNADDVDDNDAEHDKLCPGCRQIHAAEPKKITGRHTPCDDGDCPFDAVGGMDCRDYCGLGVDDDDDKEYDNADDVDDFFEDL